VKTSRIKLGCGVISPYVHHPCQIAMTIGTLDQISNKRMILGLGRGVGYWVSYQMQIPQPRTLTALRETVDIVRALLAGERMFSYDGKVFKCRDVTLGFTPPRDRVPIYMAAMGPKSLRLAGEIADGVILSAGVSIKLCEWSIKQVEIGAERAGRSLDEIDIVQYVISSVADESKVAKDAVKYILGLLVTLPELREDYLKLDGYTYEDIKPVKELKETGDFTGMVKLVPDRWAETFAAAGTSEEYNEKIEKYFEAGAKMIVPAPQGSTETIRRTIKETNV